ncbi:MAG: Ig-like domain-containing protein [Caulobacter sp.]
MKTDRRAAPSRHGIVLLCLTLGAAGWTSSALAQTNYAYDPATGKLAPQAERPSGPAAAKVKATGAALARPAASRLSVARGGVASLDPRASYGQAAQVQVSGFSAPEHGEVSLEDGALTYRPAAGYVGADAFAYSLTGPDGEMVLGVVRLSVE